MKWLVYRRGVLNRWMFSPVCAYDLYGLHLDGVYFVRGVTPFILAHLVSCRELTHFVLCLRKFWSRCERHFVYQLLAHIHQMDNLHELELTLGGAGVPLDGLLSLAMLERLTIHLEIHCDDLLVDRLVFVFTHLRLARVTIYTFCADSVGCSIFADRVDFIKSRLLAVVGLEIIFRDK